LCLSPLEEFVCDIVLVFKTIALIFFVAKAVNILNFSWLPLWSTSLVFTLDWSNRESILCSVVAFQVTSPLLLNWTIVERSKACHTNALSTMVQLRRSGDVT
jgi:hypothetical protein